MPHLTDEQRRSKFRARLLLAESALHSGVPLTGNLKQHFFSFRTYMEQHQEFAQEVMKLAPLEFEIVSIASTKHQLEAEAQFFTANEVFRTFRNGDYGDQMEQRREETRKMLLSHCSTSEAYQAAYKNDETNIMKELKQRIRHLLTPSTARKLCTQLLTELDQEPSSWPGLIFPNLGPTPTPCPISKLSPDASSLISIIHSLGGLVPPGISKPAWAWNEGGMLRPVQVQVPEVLADQTRYLSALDDLHKDSIVLANDTRGSLIIHPALTARLTKTVETKLAAVQTISRSFPRYPDDMLSITKAGKMIPQLATVLSYLDDIQLEEELQVSLAAVCLSASYFGLLPWKDYVLKVAESLVHSESSFARKLHRRQSEIRRLAYTRTLPPIAVPQTHDTGSSTIDFGESILLRLKCLADNDAPLQQFEDCARNFSPSRTTLSNQERRIAMKIQAIVARAYKHHGYFQEAMERYDVLINEHIKAESKIAIDHTILIHYAETRCELGNTDYAIRALKNELLFQPLGTGNRLNLTLANAYLMRCLLRYWNTGEIDEKSLEKAQERYRGYMKSWNQCFSSSANRFKKYNKHLALAGIAMSTHLSTFKELMKDSSVSQQLASQMAIGSPPTADATTASAMNAWQDAQIAARDCWPEPGYAEMVTLYSRSVLMSCCGNEEVAMQLNNAAKKLFQRRQHYFIGQGTIWLDILRSKAPEQMHIT